MAGEEALDAREPGGAEADAGAVALEERASQPPAEQEADGVPGDGRGGGERDDREHRGVAALGRDAAGEQDQLAVDEPAEQQAALEEDQAGDRGVDPGVERAGRVGERAGEVGQRDGSGRDGEGEREAGERESGWGETSGEHQGAPIVASRARRADMRLPVPSPSGIQPIAAIPASAKATAFAEQGVDLVLAERAVLLLHARGRGLLGDAQGRDQRGGGEACGELVPELGLERDGDDALGLAEELQAAGADDRDLAGEPVLEDELGLEPAGELGQPLAHDRDRALVLALQAGGKALDRGARRRRRRSPPWSGSR